MDLVVETYEGTSAFPPDERFGLISQMRRAAVCVPSNIAEGNARRSQRDSLRFIDIAIGSLDELTTQLEIAHRLKWLSQDEFDKLFQKSKCVGMMLTRLAQSKRRDEGSDR